MEYSDNQWNQEGGAQSIFKAILLLSFALLGFVIIGPLIGLFLSLPFIDASLMEMENMMSNPSAHENGKLLLYFMQGGATLGMFFVPWLYVKVKSIYKAEDFFKNQITPLSLPLAFIITVAFMGVNSFFIDWNAHLTFPEFMKGFEEWARVYEKAGEKMTMFLTDFNSFGEFFIALILIAVFPAIDRKSVV